MKEYNQSKAEIIASLKRNTKEVFPKPEINLTHDHYDDKVQAFFDTCNNSGGRAEMLLEGESINEAILRLFPDAKSIASNLPEIECATFNPDDAEKPADLNGTDLVVCKSVFGVCENGAVYYEQAFKHRAIYFISESILIIVDKNNLVDTMHEAYERMPAEHTCEFRGFIGGPSKTADIEQALVKGAHGPKECIMLIV
ncbi:LUD domain-containing protein [Porphyromonadaceae bacterium W3.11]|nr:LUD domain-containing protein [Porphyromonadaceae bacterium W3.11]